MTMGFPIGLSNLPLEPPDDFNQLYPYGEGAPTAGMPRAGEAQFVPAQFRSLGRGLQPPRYYPGQSGELAPGVGLAPGGGPVTEIPVPEWWRRWGPALPEILRSLHPSVFMDRALGGPDDSVYPMANLGRRRRPSASARSRSQARANDGDWCYQRYEDELQECDDNKDNYAHQDFLSACKKRATERWDKCNRNGGRPHPEESPKLGKADEDVYIETSR